MLFRSVLELIRGLEHLCERDGLSLAGLIRGALREPGPEPANPRLAEASDAELAGTIRAVRDAYARRLRARDQQLWRMECDELVGWIEGGTNG